MRLLLVSFLALSFSAIAQDDAQSFRNVREGKSYYSKNSHERAVKKTVKKISKEEIAEIYKDVFKKQSSKLCAYTINDEIKKELDARSLKVDMEGVILALRETNEIDDVAAKILLTANEVKTTSLYEKTEEELIIPSESEKTKKQIDLIGTFEKRFAKDTCFDEAYRNFYTELLKVDKKTKSYQLEVLNYMALKSNRISPELYESLEQARLNELEQGGLTLSSYQQKLKTLRIQYPLRDVKERSDFVGTKVKKMKSSRRQKLFESYTDLQIIMMGNVIKKLRNRLEYDAVEIQGFKKGELQETIPLEPMERFRFAIRALRKEMVMLSTNSYFNGRSPDYIDLMVASYEIGIIPASELEAVASLEEIWNPKKTFWDKAGIWIKTFSSVATIIIPPPYGFIPALVIVVIEATQKKKKDPNTIDPSSMF